MKNFHQTRNVSLLLLNINRKKKEEEIGRKFYSRQVGTLLGILIKIWTNSEKSENWGMIKMFLQKSWMFSEIFAIFFDLLKFPRRLHFCSKIYVSVISEMIKFSLKKFLSSRRIFRDDWNFFKINNISIYFPKKYF